MKIAGSWRKSGSHGPPPSRSEAASRLPRRSSRAPVGALLALVLGVTPPARAQSTTPIDGFWVVDGLVESLAEAAGTVYVGGRFREIGPYTGGFARIDAATAAPDLAELKVNGSVADLAADGAGGWYVAGFFTRVGQVARNNIAHILADGRLSAWNPAPDGAVLSLALSGGRLYAGGLFTTIDGQARNRIAAFDVASGSLDPAWNPNANNAVRTLALSGNDLYAGGDFTSIGGLGRNRIARLDATTGAVAAAWNPSANGTLRDLIVSGTTLFAAGQFTTIGGQARPFLAALSTTTGLASAWSPNPNNSVYEIVLSGSTLYAAGFFTSIGNPAQPRNRLAALDTSSAAALAWNPDADAAVLSIALSGATLYAGGVFANVGGQPRTALAALDTATGAPTGWDPRANDTVSVLAVAAGTVYAGGDFYSVGMSPRDRLAAIDAATGSVTAWDPGADNAVLALAASGGTVYAGGQFSNAGGQPRSFLAALDAVTGAATAWDVNPSALVRALAVSGNSVVVGGDFITIGSPSVSRPRLAALDDVTGTNQWSVGANDRVYALAASGSTVYAGGEFTTAGLAFRNRIAAIDTATGNATAWDPNASGTAFPTVYALALAPGVVYAGGDFTTIGGQPRNRVAALDDTIGNATAWNPGANLTVHSLAVSGADVYAGGNFTVLGGVLFRFWVGAVDAASGVTTAWDVNADGRVQRLVAADNRLYTGGYFSNIGNQSRFGFAAFCMVPTPAGLIAAAGGPNDIDLSWTATGAPSYNVLRSTAPGGPYDPVGSTAGTAFSDTSAEGGVTYYYVVRAVDGCESDDSNEASAVTSGSCGAAPYFEGVASVVQAAGASCGVDVSWGTASPVCGAEVSYSVYRDTAPAFTPSDANRIATGLTGTGYSDGFGLDPATAYYYAVRTRDQSNGVEDDNEIRMSIAPSACAAAPPAGVEFFNVRSGDGENTLNWLNPVAGYSSTLVLFRTDTFPTGPTDPAATVLGNFAGVPGAPVSLPHGGLPNGMDTYYYAAFADNGAGLFSGTGKTSWGRPDSAAGNVKWAFATGMTALGVAGVVPGTAYYSVSNDRVFNAMGGGAGGGSWPAGWRPLALNGPAQGRPTVGRLTSTTVGGASTIALAAAQDGRVYAVDAETGALLWASPVLGSSIQGAPSATIVDFGGAFDLVLVGTREVGGDSRFYGLNLADGSVAWVFDNGGGATGIGVINAQARVDAAAAQVFFTSNENPSGSNDTVWALAFGASSAAKLWSTPVGDVNTAVTRRGNVLYVGDEDGEVHALDVASGAVLWTSPSVGNGAVKGLVLPDFGGTRLYFSTTSLVHAINDDGSSFWLAPVAILNASPPLFLNGQVYVGGAAGRVYKIDGTVAVPPVPTSLVLGDPTVPKVVGTPTFDIFQGLLVIGTDQGEIYGVELPF